MQFFHKQYDKYYCIIKSYSSLEETTREKKKIY